MKAIVIYTSKYGSTEKYAGWIGKALECPVKKLTEITPDVLKGYDMVIYGGGLYASGISGFKKFLAKLEKVDANTKLVLFMVGLTNPEQIEIYNDVADKNIPAEWKNRFKLFAFRGDQQFSHMGVMHKIMMQMPKVVAEKKPQAERTEEETQFIESFGKDLFFSDQEAIGPLVDYVNTII